MGAADRPHIHLADLIRSRRDEILQRWGAAVRALPHAGKLDKLRLIDHIPELLDRIAVMTEDLAQGRKPELARAASERHAIARLEEGFDIDEVIGEFGVLRDVLFTLIDGDGPGTV